MGPVPSSGRKNKPKQKSKRVSQTRKGAESEDAGEEASPSILGSGSSEEAVASAALESPAFPEEDWSLVSSPLRGSRSLESRQSTQEQPSNSDAEKTHGSSSSKAKACPKSSSPEVPMSKAALQSTVRQSALPALRGIVARHTAESARGSTDAGQETLLLRQPSGHIKTGRPSSASSRRVENNTQPSGAVQQDRSRKVAPFQAVDQAGSPTAPPPAGSSHHVAPKPLSRLRRAEITTTPKVDPLAAIIAGTQDTQGTEKNPTASTPPALARTEPVFIPVAGRLGEGADSAPHGNAGTHFKQFSSKLILFMQHVVHIKLHWSCL